MDHARLRALADHPLAWPYAAALGALPEQQAWSVHVLDERLADRAGVRFVSSPPKARGARRRRAAQPGYDETITSRRVVPTREGNLHDAMNALVWATFPESKLALHARQAELVRGAQGGRSAEGDTVAMLDEGGILLCGRAGVTVEIERAGRVRDEPALCALVGAGQLVGVVFGHALLEHLARGREPEVFGLSLTLPLAELTRVAVDRALAGIIRDRSHLTARDRYGSVRLAASVLGSGGELAGWEGRA